MTIILSQNEIRAEAEKAFRGVGIDWGMAKDGGVIAAWMAAHNLPFLGALNRCLEGLDDDDNNPSQKTTLIAWHHLKPSQGLNISRR